MRRELMVVALTVSLHRVSGFGPSAGAGAWALLPGSRVGFASTMLRPLGARAWRPRGSRPSTPRGGGRWACSAVGPSKATVELSSGVSMEYFSMPAAAGAASGPKPPVVFVHGSFHSGWCWAEHFMPYFSQRGFDTFAVSLRGTNGTPLPAADAAAGINKVQMDEHCADIGAFMDAVLPGGSKPALIGHSFGGMYAQKFVENDVRPLSAAAFVCSVPPSGNSGIVGRYFLTKPGLAVDILRGLVFKQAGTNLRIARRLFFSEGLPDDTVRGYMGEFQRDCLVVLDVVKATGEFPTKTCAGPDGRASWLGRAPPLLVMGAEGDAIVDRQGVEETAAYYGVEAQWVPGAHDVMLEQGWGGAAGRLADWLEGAAAAR